MSVKVDVRQLERLQKQIERVTTVDIDAFCEACTKEIAARLLRKVIKRTPVGQYPSGSGKSGGTLRRGWSAQKDIKVHYFGDTYVVEIVNPVEYASYVEYGHRTTNHQGWVPGQFCLTISEKEIENLAPKLLESKINKLLKECFK
ncbi:HK97 gp10 family phage protein [Anaerosporobacter sp.]